MSDIEDLKNKTVIPMITNEFTIPTEQNKKLVKLENDEVIETFEIGCISCRNIKPLLIKAELKAKCIIPLDENEKIKVSV